MIIVEQIARTDIESSIIGINGYSHLWSSRTLSVNFPWSCPEDKMHTVFLNAASLFWKCFTGELITTDGPKSSEDFVFSGQHLEQMGLELEAAAKTIPDAIGEAPKHIMSKRYLYQATTWEDWLCLYSCIQLYGRLPEEHFTAWTKFVKAVTIFRTSTKTRSQIIEAKHLMIEWMEHFERYALIHFLFDI